MRAHVAELCDNNLGKEKCRTMAFTTNYNLIRTLIGQVNEYKTILNRGEAMPNGAVFDLREELERTRVAGTYLTETELLNLGKTLRSAIEIHDFFSEERRRAYPELWRLAESLSLFPDVVATIDRTLDRFGEVKDSASATLRELRSSLASTTNSINGLLSRVLSRYKNEGILDADATPAMRDGRLVLPVSAMNKRRVAGIAAYQSGDLRNQTDPHCL